LSLTPSWCKRKGFSKVSFQHDQLHRFQYTMKEKTIGKYTILEEIGRGGMGVVYKGKHASLNRFAAIKVLPAQLAVDELCLQRFLREADTLAKLQHQNIVNIYDIETQNDTQYLIMEFVNGQTLADLLKSHGPYAPDEAAKIVRDVARALSHSHAKGVIHRDIKPANIMIDEDGIVKVADFGIARAMESTAVTQTGIIGTPKYMSPERIKGHEDIDGRSDIYSLGIVFYEMVTGRVPFPDENEFTVLEKHVKKAPPPPSRLKTDLPVVYEKIILRCLAKSKIARYPTCRELVVSLEETLSAREPAVGQSSSTKVISRGKVPKITGVLNSGISNLKAITAEKKRFWPLIISALAGIAVVTFLLLPDRSDQVPHTQTTELSSPDNETTELTPLLPVQKGVSLRSVKAKNEAFLTLTREQNGPASLGDVKNWFRIKAGIKNDAEGNSELISELHALLERMEQVTTIEDGGCDILLTISKQGQTSVITVQDNVYGDGMLHAYREVLVANQQEGVLTRLETIVKRDYCFNALHAFSVLNPLNDIIGIKVETSGKTDRLFQIGDNINICMTPSRQQYCMLFNINLDGIYLLFPRFSKTQNLLKSGETQCSGSIEVSPPTGNEMIFAIMCSDARFLPLSDYQFTPSQVFQSWSYDLTDPDNAISFCEQLMLTLSSIPFDKWCAKNLFIKTM